MENIEHRAVKRWFIANGNSSQVGKSLWGLWSFIFNSKKWAAEFKRGCTSLKDDARSGCPKSSTSEEIVQQVHDMVLDDGRIKERVMVEAIGISKGSVHHILTEVVGLKKLCARWMPHLLTIDQKRI